jgi:NAD(P)-dependent dehydrogenase (short-subunit alcohol dehydrogenase family)
MTESRDSAILITGATGNIGRELCKKLYVIIAVACYVKPPHKLAVDTANGIGKVAVDLVGACKIPFAPDHIKKFEARSAIGKKRKSPKC